MGLRWTVMRGHAWDVAAKVSRQHACGDRCGGRTEHSRRPSGRGLAHRAHPDAVVVGGGLSGLAAATTYAGPASVVVLERSGPARWPSTTSPPGLGATVDAGAEFIDPTQNHIAAAPPGEHGIDIIHLQPRGDSLFWHSGTALRMPADVPLLLHPALAEAGPVLLRATADSLTAGSCGQP